MNEDINHPHAGSNPAARPALLLAPRRGALLAGHDNTLDVLVRIQAPPMPADQASARTQLDLAFVIDRSGSMAGEPLEEACRCVAASLQTMRPDDTAALIVYDHQAQVVVPRRLVGDCTEFRRALRTIASGGTTDLHGGWAVGSDQLRVHARPGAVSRVVLLSDGCANRGLTDVSAIARECAAAAVAGVTTSTYGLGEHFNEELMLAMAREGRGNPYYGRTADDLREPFREEFDLLAALVARDLRLSLSTAPGASVEVLNGYAREGTAWRLPDLAYDGEAWALARLLIPSAVIDDAARRGRKLRVLEAALGFTGLDGMQRMTPTAALDLDVLPAPAYGAVAEDDLVRRRAGELEAARMQERARAAARAGDWHTVDVLLAEAKQLGAHNPWIADAMTALEELAALRDREGFSKSAGFGAWKMSNRLAELHESGSRASEPDLRSYLRRKKDQGKREFPPTRPGTDRGPTGPGGTRNSNS
jgi:Ca-activated chloride channel family protein